MALEWADFPSGQVGIYGSGAAAVARMLNGTPWVNIGSSELTADPDPNAPAGSTVFSPRNTLLNNALVNAPSIALATPTAGKVWAAARVWFSNFSGSAREHIFAFCALSDGQTGYTLTKELNGALSIYRREALSNNSASDGLTLIGTTTAPAVSANAWVHLSFEVDPATGVCSVRREGIQILNVTDSVPAATTTGFLKTVNRVAVGAGTVYYLKDFAVGNALGVENVGHPGTVSVFDLRPNADDTLGGWTTSSGSTGFDLINETPPNDLSYIAADDAPPAPAQFELTNLPPDVTSVRALVSIVRARKVDGGDGKLQIGLTPNGTDYDDGADRPITTASTYWSDVSQLSPATTAPWSPAEVDALKIRVNRTE